MALTEDAKDSILMTGAEQELFLAQTILKHYETHIFTKNLVLDDEILIRVYIKDPQLNEESRYRTQIVRSLQENPAYIFNWLATASYRITAQQISNGLGGFKTITWVRYSI